MTATEYGEGGNNWHCSSQQKSWFSSLLRQNKSQCFRKTHLHLNRGVMFSCNACMRERRIYAPIISDRMTVHLMMILELGVS